MKYLGLHLLSIFRSYLFIILQYKHSRGRILTYGPDWMSVWICILSYYPEMSRLFIKYLYAKETDVKSCVRFLGENGEIWNFCLLCFKKGKTHASKLSCLIVCTFIWLLNPTNWFFPHQIYSLCLSAFLLWKLFQSSSPACHECSRNEAEPCVFLTQPLSAARKPQFVTLSHSLMLYCVSLC